MEATKKREKIRRWKWDVFAPPDWRARDAARLVAGERAEWADEDDVCVQEYVDYLRQIAGDGDCTQLAEAVQQSTIGAAHHLHQEDGPTRWEIEARLVAGQTDEQIGDKCGVAPEVVAAYAEVFCDVRQSLSAGDYMQVHLIGPGAHGGFQDHEVGRFWVWIAMGGGPAVLDQMIEAFHAARRSDQPAGLSVYLQPDAGVPIDVQATVASTVLPKTGPAAEAFCGMQLLLMEARAVDDPDRAACLRERARDWLIKCARAHLAGKPLPRPRKRRETGDRKGDRTHGPTSKRRPLTFEQWDDLVTAAFSDRHVTRPRKS